MLPHAEPHGRVSWPITPAESPARPHGRRSTYRATHPRDWREQRRLRMAGCPWPGCEFYTVAAVVMPDGQLGEVLGGWPGSILDMPGIANWEGIIPWSALTSLALTSTGANTWTKDATWNNASNDVYVIGGGGGGSWWQEGGGGGGGGYSHSSSVSLAGSTINYTVGIGGLGSTTGSGGNGGNSWFNGTSLAASSVGANGGAGDPNGFGGAGGSTSGAVGTNKNAGGAGNEAPAGGGGGGGGAGGTNGVGAAGGSGDTSNNSGGGGGGSGGGTAGAASGTGSGTGGAGGNNFGGTGSGAGGNTAGNGANGTNGGGGGGCGNTGPSHGGLGGNGTEFDASHGSGGGGGGNIGQTSLVGGSGGTYGGGAGGSGGTSAGNVGSGAQGLVFLTWTPAASGTPTAQNDWPNPRTSAKVLASTNVGVAGIILTLAGGGGKPFGQADWPLTPRVQERVANRTHLDPMKLELRGQDRFFGSPGMGPDYDFPNPRLPIVRRQDFQSGAFNPIRPPTNPTTPFQPTDWPQVRPVVRQLQDVGVPAIVIRNASQPFRLADWPNPRVVTRGVDALAIGETTLAGQDTFFGGPGQPPVNTDQPPPGRARVQRQDFSAPSPATLLHPPLAVPLPFGLLDQPNPMRRPSRQVETFTAETALVGQDVLPPGQDDWQLPRLGVVQRQDFTSLPFGRAPPGPVPFGLMDWPNPRGAQLRNLEPGTDALTTLPLALPPFYQSDWPLARGPQARNLEPGPGAITTLPFNHAPPFTPPDLPNPVLARSFLRDFQAGMPRELVGADALPPGQDDWAIHRPVLRFAHDPGDIGLTIVSIAPVPFVQLEWPNPVRRTPAQDGFLGRFALVAGTDVLAFRQSDWPVTPAARRAPQDFMSAGTSVFANVPVPFNTYDWPVTPAAPQRDRTFVPFTLALRVPQPFGQSDFPNPRGSQPRDLAVRLGATPLVAQIGAPFSLSDQPNPLRPRFWTADVAPNPLAYRAMPFVISDWPVPRAAAHPIELRTSQPNPMPAGGVQPFNYADWWPGRAPQRETVTFTYVLALSIQGPGAQLSSVQAGSTQLWSCTATSVWSGGKGTGPGMSIPNYPLDTQIALQGTFRNVAGLLVDPSAVTCRVVDGLGNLVVYSGAQITRASVGIYTLNITPKVSGSWYFDWQGMGAAIATSGDARFNVAKSVAIRG